MEITHEIHNFILTFGQEITQQREYNVQYCLGPSSWSSSSKISASPRALAMISSSPKVAATETSKSTSTSSAAVISILTWNFHFSNTIIRIFHHKGLSVLFKVLSSDSSELNDFLKQFVNVLSVKNSFCKHGHSG